jgi:hypothetical protein
LLTRFGKQDFIYVEADDIYRCPAGERLTTEVSHDVDSTYTTRHTDKTALLLGGL